MKRLVFAVAAVAALLLAAPAYAFHPDQETYGYVSPKKLKKMRAAQAAKYSYGSYKYQKKNKYGYAQKKKYKSKNANLKSGYGSKVSAGKPGTVRFAGKQAAGSIVIDTARRKLYYVLPGQRAYQYPVAVGKKGFTWTGTKRITRKQAWPDWRPPAEMRQRKPELPVHMKGGKNNPLGAMALYLGSSLYRIHGTNNPGSIGQAVSSGCIRMQNAHVLHLAKMAGVGTKVHVVRKLPSYVAGSGGSGSNG